MIILKVKDISKFSIKIFFLIKEKYNKYFYTLPVQRYKVTKAWLFTASQVGYFAIIHRPRSVNLD